jgi:hypothetical protein
MFKRATTSRSSDLQLIPRNSSRLTRVGATALRFVGVILRHFVRRLHHTPR